MKAMGPTHLRYHAPPSEGVMGADDRAVGGFYEAIVALMVVTAGVVLLTTAFTLLLAGQIDEGEGSKAGCEEALSKIIEDPALAKGYLMLDGRELDHVDYSALLGDVKGGVKVMLSYPDGSISVLHEEGGPAMEDRESRSVPVNIFLHQGDIRAAIITVWVWQ